MPSTQPTSRPAGPSRVLVASPPPAAVGGVAAHTGALTQAADEMTAFDQWWPMTRRSDSRLVRTGVHGLGLARWVTATRLGRPDVVHLQVTSPGIARDIVYLKVAKAAGVPVVAHLHTSGFFGPRSTPQIRERFAAIVEGADAVVVMSQLAADEVAAHLPGAAGKLHVVPNPAAVGTSTPLPVRAAQATCRFLCVAEINDLKGQARVAEQVERLAAAGVPARLILVGPRGAVAEHDWTALEANPHVQLTGVRRGEELVQSFTDADVFVLFSDTEAEPMAMLEAMAMGLPVIATSVGSIPATLADAAGPGGGENVIVAPGDTDALYDALTAMATDPDRRARVGAANAAWARTTRSLSRHVDGLRQVHRSVTR